MQILTVCFAFLYMFGILVCVCLGAESAKNYWRGK